MHSVILRLVCLDDCMLMIKRVALMPFQVKVR